MSEQLGLFFKPEPKPEPVKRVPVAGVVSAAAYAIDRRYADSIILDAEQQAEVANVALIVSGRYQRGAIATMKFLPEGVTLDDIEPYELRGYGGEYAAAIETGLEWHRGNARKCDIGLHTEVRTAGFELGDLVIYHFDAKTPGKLRRPFISVTGTFPVFKVRGWQYGFIIAQPEWWKPKGSPLGRGGKTTGAAGWWYPQRLLRPMSEYEDEPA